MQVSIVIPCYNATDKIGRCFGSLRKLEFDAIQFEVIFIDDYSNDGTFELVQGVCRSEPNWRIVRLESNSGSPSRPRNRGIDEAQGTYIYFLDCDDEILPNALRELYALAQTTNACVVRSALLADDGKQRKLMNQLLQWSDANTLQQRIELIIAGQSTVPTSFVRTTLLRQHNIRWAEHLRMGEDTVFLAKLLASAEHVAYLPVATYIYYKVPSLTPASTQRYGRKELSDHLEVWDTAQTVLQPIGVDYIRKRLHIGLRVALESLIYRNRGDVNEQTFDKLSDFVNHYWSVVLSFQYATRLKELLKTIKDRNYVEFLRQARPRLLIAGHDLKFITDAIPELDQYFDIRIDEWKGHASHDEKASLKSLEWAELIWCEWLLGNAEWYSKNKKSNQRLVVRMHRMELGRNHGESLNMAAVDAVIAVSTFFFERLLERFPNIPRRKVRLMHNYVRVEQYQRTWHPDRLFTLCLIGILPSRKGLKTALHILNALHKKDKRFNLKIFGKAPEDLSWIARDKTEMDYFSDCKSFITKNKLENVVHFLGHADIKTALDLNHVGYVLSVSESEFGFPGFESFHLAIADGFSSGGVSLILHWMGAEYIWPSEYICETPTEMISRILELCTSSTDFDRCAVSGQKFTRENYDVSVFARATRELFLDIA